MRCHEEYNCCNAIIKEGRRKETSKFTALSWCTYNIEICFVHIEPNSIVCHPTRDITETLSKILKGKISVSAVNKNMYTWVSSAYKWWSNLWLSIRERSGMAYRVNNIGPRTEALGTSQNKGVAFDKQFLIFIDWNRFSKNERIQVSAVPDMPYQSERRSWRTE